MKPKTLKIVGLVFIVGVISAGSIGAYIWFKPHRDVQAVQVYAELKVKDLVNEFSTDAAKANAKYLSCDGNSKVLIVEGRVSNITTNQKGEKVIVLKDQGAKAGVSATFTLQTNSHIEFIKIGDAMKVKGAITAGNSYDADLDLYEHAILVQCDFVK